MVASFYLMSGDSLDFDSMQGITRCHAVNTMMACWLLFLRPAAGYSARRSAATRPKLGRFRFALRYGMMMRDAADDLRRRPALTLKHRQQQMRYARGERSISSAYSSRAIDERGRCAAPCGRRAPFRCRCPLRSLRRTEFISLAKIFRRGCQYMRQRRRSSELIFRGADCYFGADKPRSRRTPARDVGTRFRSPDFTPLKLLPISHKYSPIDGRAGRLLNDGTEWPNAAAYCCAGVVCLRLAVKFRQFHFSGRDYCRKTISYGRYGTRFTVAHLKITRCYDDGIEIMPLICCADADTIDSVAFDFNMRGADDCARRCWLK